MYARWTLDCLVEIAHAISKDYFSAPEFYQGDAPGDIVDLWLSYGHVKNFPDKAQRYVLAGAIFGDSDGYPSVAGSAAPYNDSFHKSRDPLFKACIAALAAGNSPNRTLLDENVRKVLPTFQNYLNGFSGKAAQLAYTQILNVSDLSFSILRSDTVSSRFIGSVGTHKPILTTWPLKDDSSSGDMLITESSSRLNLDGIDMPKGFAILRAIAQAGQEALDVIVDQPPPKDLTDLIRKTYTWATLIDGYWQPSGTK